MDERAAEHVILLNICRCGQIRTIARSTNEKEARILGLNCHGNFLGQTASGVVRAIRHYHIGNSHRTGLHIVDWWTRISVFAVMVFCKEAMGLVHLGFSPEAFLLRVKRRLMNPLEGSSRLMRHV